MRLTSCMNRLRSGSSDWLLRRAYGCPSSNSFHVHFVQSDRFPVLRGRRARGACSSPVSQSTVNRVLVLGSEVFANASALASIPRAKRGFPETRPDKCIPLFRALLSNRQDTEEIQERHTDLSLFGAAFRPCPMRSVLWDASRVVLRRRGHIPLDEADICRRLS